MKSMWPGKGGILFMPYFYRTGGGEGGMAPELSPQNPKFSMRNCNSGVGGY